MEVLSKRKEFYDDRTIGHFFLDGALFCYVLEDRDRQIQPDGSIIPWAPNLKVYGQTAIPRGRYRLVINQSQKFRRMMPEILNVQSFTGIRLHDGEGPQSTEGCLILSYQMQIRDGKHWLIRNKEAFDKFFLLLASNKDDAWITIA